MKKSIFLAAVIFSFGVSFSGTRSFLGEKRVFSLKEDLSIGVENGDENLMFSSLEAIDVDLEGNIYILDWSNSGDSRLQKFSERGDFLKSIAIKKGQGPEEVAMFGGAAVSPAGTIFVLDRGGRKIVVLGKDGQFLRFFKLDFQASCLGCLAGEKVVVLGLNGGKILHLFDQNGKLLASFGNPFEVPSHLSRYKDVPLLKYPMRFSCSDDGHIFVFNPHKFEISVYKDGQLEKKLPGKSDLFEPLRIPRSSSQRIAIVFPFLTILEFGNRLYITVMRPATKGEGSNELIIYERDKPVGTLTVEGIPRAVDSKGRIYVAEEAYFPRLMRYSVSEK